MAQTSFGGAPLVASGADGDQHFFSSLPPQEVKIGSLELPNVTFLTLTYPRKDSYTSEVEGLSTTNLFRYLFIGHAGHFAVLVPR
jgi:hypothetical protein